MPFGVFEAPLIKGTLTEAVYEVDDMGLKLRFAPDLGGSPQKRDKVLSYESA